MAMIVGDKLGSDDGADNAGPHYSGRSAIGAGTEG